MAISREHEQKVSTSTRFYKESTRTSVGARASGTTRGSGWLKFTAYDCGVQSKAWQLASDLKCVVTGPGTNVGYRYLVLRHTPGKAYNWYSDVRPKLEVRN